LLCNSQRFDYYPAKFGDRSQQSILISKAYCEPEFCGDSSESDPESDPLDSAITAQPILRRFGYETRVRPSLALYNTYANIDTRVSALQHLQGGRYNY
ncbi:MAG: hypothetical protein ABIN99_09130, partial [Nitrosospira sp.]